MTAKPEQIREQRKAIHGDPEHNGECIGYYWGGILAEHFQTEPKPIPAHVVHLMLAAYKLGRAARPFPKPDADDYADAINYTTFAHEQAPNIPTADWSGEGCNPRKDIEDAAERILASEGTKGPAVCTCCNKRYARPGSAICQACYNQPPKPGTVVAYAENPTNPVGVVMDAIQPTPTDEAFRKTAEQCRNRGVKMNLPPELVQSLKTNFERQSRSLIKAESQWDAMALAAQIPGATVIHDEVLLPEGPVREMFLKNFRYAYAGGDLIARQRMETIVGELSKGVLSKSQREFLTMPPCRDLQIALAGTGCMQVYSTERGWYCNLCASKKSDPAANAWNACDYPGCDEPATNANLCEKHAKETEEYVANFDGSKTVGEAMEDSPTCNVPECHQHADVDGKCLRHATEARLDGMEPLYRCGGCNREVHHTTDERAKRVGLCMICFAGSNFDTPEPRQHILWTPEECARTHREDLTNCPICDGGLAVCKICGTGEAGLDEFGGVCPGPKTGAQIVRAINEAGKTLRPDSFVRFKGPPNVYCDTCGTPIPICLAENRAEKKCANCETVEASQDQRNSLTVPVVPALTTTPDPSLIGPEWNDQQTDIPAKLDRITEELARGQTVLEPMPPEWLRAEPEQVPNGIDASNFPTWAASLLLNKDWDDITDDEARAAWRWVLVSFPEWAALNADAETSRKIAVEWPKPLTHEGLQLAVAQWRTQIKAARESMDVQAEAWVTRTMFECERAGKKLPPKVRAILKQLWLDAISPTDSTAVAVIGEGGSV